MFEKRNPVHIFATKTWSMIKISADKDADQREIYNKNSFMSDMRSETN